MMMMNGKDRSLVRIEPTFRHESKQSYLSQLISYFLFSLSKPNLLVRHAKRDQVACGSTSPDTVNRQPPTSKPTPHTSSSTQSTTVYQANTVKMTTTTPPEPARKDHQTLNTLKMTTATPPKPARKAPQPLNANPTTTNPKTITKPLHHRITLHPTLTPYRRRVYRALLTVPPGRWTTYTALATHLGSSARAVGNAMRTNPFAPDVPCHRVLAADGSLGGYKGEWRVSACIGDGSFAEEKRLRLEGEGVVFDERGRARGVCFVEFGDLKDLKDLKAVKG